MPLSANQIRSIKSSQKVQRFFDGRGLYLEVTRTGKKYWRLKYRHAGREKRISLGIYPDVSLKDARQRRYEAWKLLDRDIDPSEQRQEIRDGLLADSKVTFEIVAREWFRMRDRTWAKSHSSKVLGRLENDVFPWIGKTPIRKISPRRLLSVVRRIEERGAIESAHRVLACCGQIFRYAIATDRADRDPAVDLRGALAPFKRGHFAAVTEPERLGRLLRQLYAYEGSNVVRAALRIAPLVFVRPGELRMAKWQDFDLRKAEWRFTVRKTGTPHIVPLATQAVKIVEDLKPLTDGGTYVFPNGRSPRGDRPMSDNAVLAAMRSMDIAKDEMSGHGFRAVARTLLDEELGYRPDIIEHQLAHRVIDPNGRAYNRTQHLPERKAMMQHWADYLQDLRETKPDQ